MPSSEFDLAPLQTALLSHAQRLGIFDRIQGAEPKNAPGNGISYAMWAQRIGPQPLQSGLQRTTVRVTMNGRVYQNFVSEPQDAIDVITLNAVGELMTAYSGDFTLRGRIKNVDLLGQSGPGLGAEAGYIEIDHIIYRVMTLTIPLILNDQFVQEATDV